VRERPAWDSSWATALLALASIADIHHEFLEIVYPLSAPLAALTDHDISMAPVESVAVHFPDGDVYLPWQNEFVHNTSVNDGMARSSLMASLATPLGILLPLAYRSMIALTVVIAFSSGWVT